VSWCEHRLQARSTSPLGTSDWRFRHAAAGDLGPARTLKHHSCGDRMMESRHLRAGEPAKKPRRPRDWVHADGGLRVRDGSSTPIRVQEANIYGFALPERDLGFETPGCDGEAAQRRAENDRRPGKLPHLAELSTKLPDSGYGQTVGCLGGWIILAASSRAPPRGQAHRDRRA